MAFVVVEVVALSELQVVERNQQQSSSSSTTWWTSQSATETGIDGAMDIPVVRARLGTHGVQSVQKTVVIWWSTSL